MKFYITKAEDRDALCMIFARNGYIVCQGKDKPAGEKNAKPYVEVLNKDEIYRRSASDEPD